MNNIVLIGPPGVGKSTIGVLLAKYINFNFIDTDVIIQSHEGRRLQNILDDIGRVDFIKLEENYILKISVDKTIIATGGSVIYSQNAINHLKKDSQMIYLDLPWQELLKRIDNLDTRGVVKPNYQTFEEMYSERTELYTKAADIIINCMNKNHDEVVKMITEKIKWDE